MLRRNLGLAFHQFDQFLHLGLSCFRIPWPSRARPSLHTGMRAMRAVHMWHGGLFGIEQDVSKKNGTHYSLTFNSLHAYNICIIIYTCMYIYNIYIYGWIILYDIVWSLLAFVLQCNMWTLGHYTGQVVSGKSWATWQVDHLKTGQALPAAAEQSIYQAFGAFRK